ASQAEGIEAVGDLTQPNLEKTLLLDPDLIVISESQRRLYRQLSRIAPTVSVSPRVNQWQDRFWALAEAVNQTAKAEQLLDEYDQKVAAFERTMGDRLSEIDVSYIRVRTDGIFLYVKSSLVGDVMTDLGIQRPPAQDVILERSPRIPISLEELDKADGDIMFVFGVEFGDTQDMFAQLQTNPLWQQLNAVKTNQVHVVTGAYWSFPGIQGAKLLIDDLTQHLTQYLAAVDSSGSPQ
ncbi:MAG: iron-siderophore ABC transporter substrate-binding protein, partial [Cyanobacteria bacterium J06636_28]